MIYTLENGHISLSADTLGAQLLHLRTSDGREYLWQGDPAFWKGRSPLLFPFIGRLTQGCHQYENTRYPMNTHGFARATEFSVKEKTDDQIIFALSETEETKRQYPFDFSLEITYRLKKNTIWIGYRVENTGEKVLPFAIGGHPGFNVPLQEGEAFEDYEILFSEPCNPLRIGFTESVFLDGSKRPFPLENGNRISLSHQLFDDDAIILENVSHEVTLRSRLSGTGVRLSYPEMPYLGIWHMPKLEAPYVCLEPWSSLPSRQDVIEDFSKKEDMLRLKPHKTYTNTWSITLI